MPTYEMQAPDGSKYRIDGPAGASDDQVREQIIRQYPQLGQQEEASASASASTSSALA